MPKQTRLNFSKQPATASKRRKRDSDDETDEENERPPQRSKTTGSSESSFENTGKQSSPTKSSGNTKKTTSDISSPTSKPTTQTNTPQSHITLTHYKSSLFASPPSTLLCHATNAQGSWGAGIAAAFKKSYPSAFKIYAAHCSKWSGSSLLGTTLLIPPQHKSPLEAEREAKHWIGCLFTSEKKGKGKGSKESILEATGEAVEDLVRKVRDLNEGGDGVDGKAKAGSSKEDRIDEVRMCKINSGLFGVPWEATREVIEGVEIGEGDLEEIAVYSLD